MELDLSTASPSEIWEALGVDPERRDRVVRTLEQMRAAEEQTARAKETREERFVGRLLSFAGQRGKPDDQGYRYFLIWYAKSHGERGVGLRRGKKSSAPPSASSQRVAYLLRASLDSDALKDVDNAIQLNWDSVANNVSLKQMASEWRKLFIDTYLTDEERDEYKDLIKSVLPPIYLQRRSWRHRHEAATSCLMQWLLIGTLILTAQSQTPDVPYNENELPMAAPQPASSADVVHDPPTDEQFVSHAAQQSQPAGEVLRQQPFFRLMSLSQDVAGMHHPGHAPEILRQGWEDYSDLTSVPAEHAEQWRRVQDLDRQAAAAFDEGRYEAALELYKQLIATKNQASGWDRLSGGIDIDDYVTLVIARRGHTSYLIHRPALDGPAVLGLKQYEFGRMYEDQGYYQKALVQYGSCIWRHLVVPDNVQAMEAENLAASNWHHLGDLRQIYNDASARAFGLAAELSAERHALLSKDFALWLTSQGLVAISLSPRVPAVCAAFDRGPDLPSHNMGEDWRISTDYDDIAYEQKDLSFANSGIVIRPAAPPAAPTRKTLVVHWRLMTDDPERAACHDVATRIDFCFFPDGRLMDVQACP